MGSKETALHAHFRQCWQPHPPAITVTAPAVAPMDSARLPDRLADTHHQAPLGEGHNNDLTSNAPQEALAPSIVGMPRVPKRPEAPCPVRVIASETWERETLRSAVLASQHLQLVDGTGVHRVEVVARRDWPPPAPGRACSCRTVVVAFEHIAPGAVLLECGGYLARGAPFKALPELVFAAAGGGGLYVVPLPEMPEAEQHRQDPRYVCLTQDEVRLLEGLSRGVTQDAMCGELCESRAEVNRHLAKLREKLGVWHTHEAIFLWGRLRLTL